jgi:hypothetical protein
MLKRLPVLAALWLAGLWVCGSAWGQFVVVPSPLPAERQNSNAETDRDYRRDGARHIYAALPMRIFKGRMPPLLYGIAITETDIDADGNVVDVRVIREPVAAEVGPWIQLVIRRVAPYPPPTKMGRVTYTEVWLVHKSGNFQLDTLTEGQD